MDLRTEMPISAQPNPKAAEFYRQAAAFVKQAKLSGKTSLTPIKRDSDEFRAWEDYFRVQGWEPVAFEMVRRKALPSVTVPAQWPQWFDTSFALSERRPAPEPPSPRLIDKAAIERIERQFGPNWGLKVGGKGLKPLPEERITRRAVSPRPKMPAEADIPSPEETPADRLARLKATPVEVSPELAARFTSRNESAA